MKTIQERGEIIVAMEGTWSPWTYHDENDELVGYDVEVAKLIARELGVEAKFVEGEWDGLLGGLESGRYDIMANGVEITEERAQKYDFSEPYGYIHTALIVHTDNDAIKSYEDLDGKTTANSISSTYMTLAESYGAKGMRVTKAEDIKNALKSAKQNTKMPTVIEFIIDRETNVMPIVPPGNSLNDMILERKTGMMNSSPC